VDTTLFSVGAGYETVAGVRIVCVELQYSIVFFHLL